MDERRHLEGMKLKLGVALVTVYLVWGSTYLAISVADRSLPPLLMLAVRFLIAGGLMYGWSLWRGDVVLQRCFQDFRSKPACRPHPTFLQQPAPVLTHPLQGGPILDPNKTAGN